jgi:hypothetical protein
MIVAIVGDREVTDYSLVDKAIEQSGFEVTEVVSGGARGVDSLAERWARDHNIPCKVFKADWNNLRAPGAVIKVNKWRKKYNANAGFARNQDIVDYAEAVIAIQPNGPTSGTQDTVRRTKKAKKPLHYYEKEDSDYEYQF